MASADFWVPILSSTKDAGLVGGGVMQHFTWTFDRSTKRFRMIRNDPNGQITFPPLTGHGPVYSPTVDGLLVRAILTDAQAQRFDVKPGDLVTQIDGQPILQRGCNTPDADTRTVGFFRDGQFREVTLEPYTLVP